jgi:hypothetical protein
VAETGAKKAPKASPGKVTVEAKSARAKAEKDVPKEDPRDSKAARDRFKKDVLALGGNPTGPHDFISDAAKAAAKKEFDKEAEEALGFSETAKPGNE